MVDPKEVEASPESRSLGLAANGAIPILGDEELLVLLETEPIFATKLSSAGQNRRGDPIPLAPSLTLRIDAFLALRSPVATAVLIETGDRLGLTAFRADLEIPVDRLFAIPDDRMHAGTSRDG